MRVKNFGKTLLRGLGLSQKGSLERRKELEELLGVYQGRPLAPGRWQRDVRLVRRPCSGLRHAEAPALHGGDTCLLVNQPIRGQIDGGSQMAERQTNIDEVCASRLTKAQSHDVRRRE
jgi:hypothetical protein